MVVKEGEPVVLSCKAGGNPQPVITWKREDGKAIPEEYVDGM